MRVRIRISPETVKELLKALPKAYQSGDSRMVKRVIALLDYRRGDQPRGIADQDEVAVSTVYQGLKELLIEGIASLKPQWRGGRGQKLTEKQRHCLREWLQAGRPAAGYPTGGWSALWVQDRIQREFGLLYKADYLAEVLKGGGFSWQKARFVSDHLDEGNRFVWLKEVFPAGKRQAQAAAGLLLFGDQASFAPWGSLGYPWVPLGHQPTVATSGKRRGQQVLGWIELFTGRLFYQGLAGQFHAASYIAFRGSVLTQTGQPLFLVQDGAKYHTAQAVGDFVQQHAQPLTVTRLPSYSPDQNPIECLWRTVKRPTTHNVYFAEFHRLVTSVEEALAYFQSRPDYVRSLFTRYPDDLAQPTALDSLAA